MDCIVAVSGGSDSMALLNWLEENKKEYVVCHVNYKHRPTADRDESIVRRWCKSHNRPMEVLYPVYKSGNFEAWARDVRYKFFEDMAKKYHVNDLYVGHHQGDLLETWFLQKNRGSIPTIYGLQERTERNGITVVRPLLSYTKKELEEICSSKGIEWGLDETNLSNEYQRNRIRHELIEPSSEAQRRAWLDEIKEDNTRLSNMRERAQTLIVSRSARRILESDIAWFVLGEMEYQRTGCRSSRKNLEDRVFQLKENGKAEKWYIADDEIRYMEKIEELYIQYRTLDEFVKSDNINKATDTTPVKDIVYVKEEDFPLVIRSPKKEDKITMRYGTKKVMKILRDRKIPEPERYKYFVVESKRGLIFLTGTGGSKANFRSGVGYSIKIGYK